MRMINVFSRRLPVVLSGLLLLAAFAFLPIGKASAAIETLTVALYPYVPRLDQFEDAIKQAWGQVQPDVTLKFITDDKVWDGGYKKDPLPEWDVYVFDAMFFEYFKSKDWLESLAASEVNNLSDFLPYAIEGVKVEDKYLAIPLLGCANILFYQESDQALAYAKKLSQVQAALSQCTYSSLIPPDRRGLMLDLAGGTTNVTMYLDAAHSITGVTPLPMPQNQSEIDKDAMANVRSLLAMASYWNGTADDLEPYERGTWFNEYGRGYIGFTESMSAMSPEMRSEIGFRVMPMANGDEPHMFYADVIAVNPKTNNRGTRKLAVQLANVMAASDTVRASIGPDSSNEYPQYLMAARPTVFNKLGEKFPIYNDMLALVQPDAIMFGLDEHVRDWLTSMKNTIRNDVRADYPCGCDFPSAVRINSNAEAPAQCTPTCQNYGGWSGSWTNHPPAPGARGSVCGCKSCPLPESFSAADPTPRPNY